MNVNTHPTWEILDSTKVKAFLNCPRKFFYRHILGWVPDRTSIHLVHGSAWHKAMEVIFEHGKEQDTVALAFQAYMDEYRASIDPELDDGYAPKNPQHTAETLVEYVQNWKQECFETLYIEVAGTMPISLSEDKERRLYFKMDTINQGGRDDDYFGVFSLEHKTTGALSERFRSQWSLDFQTAAYHHALLCMFSPEETYGIVINGAVFRKSSPEFLRIPVKHSLSKLKAWLWEANHTIDLIEWNLRELQEDDPSEDVMMSFPRNPESCFKYGKCPYFDFCASWTNPLQKDPNGDPPPGFKKEYWDPRAQVEEAKYEADLSFKPGESQIKQKEEEHE